jgi:hypothetical protein
VALILWKDSPGVAEREYYYSSQRREGFLGHKLQNIAVLRTQARHYHQHLRPEGVTTGLKSRLGVGCGELALLDLVGKMYSKIQTCRLG